MDAFVEQRKGASRELSVAGAPVRQPPGEEQAAA